MKPHSEVGRVEEVHPKRRITISPSFNEARGSGKLGVLVVVVLIELMDLFGVGIHQLPEFLEYIAIGMHSLLDLGGASADVLQFPVHLRIVLPVEVHPLHSRVEALNTSSVEPC